MRWPRKRQGVGIKRWDQDDYDKGVIVSMILINKSEAD
jgi:hypothetical protein